MANERQAAFQDTGNPVLDSFVNALAGMGVPYRCDSLSELYEAIRELALKEPGGLKRRTGDGRLEAHDYDSSAPPDSFRV